MFTVRHAAILWIIESLAKSLQYMYGPRIAVSSRSGFSSSSCGQLQELDGLLEERGHHEPVVLAA